MNTNNKIFRSCLYLCVMVITGFSFSCSDSNNVAVPKANELAPDSASGGSVLTLTGSGLSDMRHIIFTKDSIPAPFNPTFNTDHALIFRVPDTAFGGKQDIIFINSTGKKLSVPFNVIALATVSQASLYEFIAGTEITIKGNNLETVSEVTVSGTTDKATIVSKEHRMMVIKMPATEKDRVTLDITNASGTMTTHQEFINVDKAFPIFTEGFGTGIFNWSWSSASVSTDFSILGGQSLKSVYSAGSWQAVSLHCDPTLDASQYTYLTFWVKGGTADTQLDVKSENGGTTNTITVPANVWTYFKFNTSGFITGFPIERLDFQIHGPDGSDQTLYFDDILLVK